MKICRPRKKNELKAAYQIRENIESVFNYLLTERDYTVKENRRSQERDRAISNNLACIYSLLGI
jgi:hypothetical protein